MKKHYLFFVTMLLFNTLTFSQSNSCGFEAERSKLRQDPTYVALEKAAEKRIQDVIKSENFAKSSSSSSVLTIPVVIHVLHLGEAVGTGSNISDAQIQSSINHLNDFYRGQTTNSLVDFEIEFALAKRDPNCNVTTGINRIDASGVTNYASDGISRSGGSGADENTLKDLSRWSETEYFNVWIVTEINGNNGGSGIQGYASFFYGNNYEGSVMMSSVFGYDPGNTNGWGLNSNGDNSTVVHEVGHYFHLYHTFQGDDANGDGVSDRCPNDTGVGDQSDGCADTETHQRETSTCPTQNTCSGVNWVDNNTINNIMSYYNCTDRMTNDQKTRVRAAMEGTSIVSSKGAEAPDASYTAPVAVCNTNSTSTNFAGITSVGLNGVTFSSFSSSSDGGNIDKSANCSNFFEIDVSNTNTINVGMFPSNWQQLGIWIDWNDDGDFDDDEEQQYLANDIEEGTTVSHNLTYPESIPFDDYVRIRLITDLDNRYGTSLIASSCHSSIQYGQSEDYAIYVKPEFSITWTGTTDTNWGTATNWSTNTIPALSDKVLIPNGLTNYPTASSAITVSEIIIESGASFITTSTVSGNITYKRNLPTNNWYLSTSPLNGEEVIDFLKSHDLSKSAATSGVSQQVGLASYDNTQVSNKWNYYTIGDYDDLNADDTSDSMNSGEGFSIKLTSSGDISFSGNMNTENVTRNISTGAGDAYNLVGNPYPSYINADTFLTTNSITSTDIDGTIWVWNQATDAYDAKNLTSGLKIAPAQGFFVKKAAGSSILFEESSQSHETTDTFQKSSKTEIKLSISNGTDSKYAQIFYIDGTTTGFDTGYDSELFDGVTSNLSMYSHLLTNNTGKNYQIQSLPNSGFEAMVIPIGVKAESGKEIIFSADVLSFPSSLNIFLEDKLTNTFTSLGETDDEYKVTLEEDLNGVGRFYLHTSSESLNIQSIDFKTISLYCANKKIFFSNLPNGNTEVMLYDVLGELILKENITETAKYLSVTSKPESLRAF